MSSSFKEFEGKNVDFAIKNACDELKISTNQLSYDVISKGTSGIFGFLRKKKAKIKVKLPAYFENKRGSQGEALSLVNEAFGTNEGSMLEFPDEPLNIGNNALQKILDLITLDAKITIEKKSDYVLYKVEGGNSALLIGKRGQTLEAMQYLVDKIVNRNSIERIRVQIDVEGYLESRRESLESLALRLAEKTKRTGKPSTISQMTAHDRRIVHLTLKDDRGVRTQSMGDGYYRRLVIFPKRGNYNQNRQRRSSYNNNRYASHDNKNA